MFAEGNSDVIDERTLHDTTQLGAFYAAHAETVR